MGGHKKWYSFWLIDHSKLIVGIVITASRWGEKIRER